jgi:hypothetical protein
MNYEEKNYFQIIRRIITRNRVAIVGFIFFVISISSFLVSRVQVILNLDTDVYISEKLKIMVNEKLSVPLKINLDVPLDDDVVVETILNLDIVVPIETDVTTLGGISIPVKANVPIKTKVPIKQVMHISGKITVLVEQTVSIPVNQNVTASIHAHVPAGVKLKGIAFPLQLNESNHH